MSFLFEGVGMKHCSERWSAPPCGAPCQRSAGEAHREVKSVCADRDRTDSLLLAQELEVLRKLPCELKSCIHRGCSTEGYCFPLLVLFMSFGPDFCVELSRYLISFPICLWPPALTGMERVGKHILP